MNPGEYLVELARQNVSFDEFCQEAREIERKSPRDWQAALNFQHPEENGVPAISFFIRKQRSELLRFYLQEGCDVELMDLRHVGALGVASIFGDQDCVELLVDYQANANTKCALGCSNLLFSIHLQHLETVRYLVEKGKADVNEKDRNGCGPLLIACMVGSLPIVKYLLTHTNVSILDRHVNGWAALVFAAYHGCLELLVYLDSVLRNDGHSALPNLSLDVRQDYHLCLVLAAKCGYFSIVTFFVENVQVPVNSSDNAHNTPLISACVAGHEKIVSYLLQREADVRKVNSDGDSALMLAVRRGYLSIVRMLLSKLEKSSSNKSEIVDMINLKNFKGLSAMAMAETDVMRTFLAQYGAI
eukprot:gene37506-45548_t